MCLETKIKGYCEAKEQEKSLKKDISALGNEIKEYLTSHDGKAEADGWTVVLQPRNVESVDEEKMLYVIKSAWTEHNGSMQCPYIRTVEVLDMDALESAIYRGDISDETLLALDGCRTKTTQYALTYKKKKEK